MTTRMLVALQPPCCDIAGATMCVYLPQWTGRLFGLYIVGRKPAEIERIAVNVNGIVLLDLGPYVDDDGADRTGGELAASLQVLRGYAKTRLVLPVPGLMLRGNNVHTEITLAPGVEQGRTRLFARVDHAD